LIYTPADYFGDQFPSEIRPLASELFNRLMDGSICISLDEHDLGAEEVERLRLNEFRDSFDKLNSAGIISEDPDSSVPFILFQGRLYMQRYFKYERSIVRNIERIVSRERQTGTLNERKDALLKIKEFIIENFREPLEKTGGGPDFQMIAAIEAFLNHFTIITGGPGVGKTTSMKKFLSILLSCNPDMRVILCAPTGKAAQRMKETLSKTVISGIDIEIVQKIRSIGEQAQTIHKTLGFIGTKNSLDFKHNSENPLDCDLLIVDESSMIDVALFAKLLDAVPDTSRVVLMGDKDQLASVEAASIFGDLCQPGIINVFSDDRVNFLNNFLNEGQRLIFAEPDRGHLLSGRIIELRHSHRFSGNSGIGILSKAVIQGDTRKVNEVFGMTYGDIAFDELYDDGVFNNFAMGFANYIRHLAGYSFSIDRLTEAFRLLNKYRILVAIRDGNQGLHTVNQRVEKLIAKVIYDEYGIRLFNPSASEFYEFRPIMVTRNNYSVSPTLYNGDVGIIARDEGGELKAWFDKDGEIKSYPPGQLGVVETNFAQTIHKSQGSEYERILVMLPKNRDVRIMTRELLYTGITRAVSHVTLVATKEVCAQTVEQKVQRISGLQSAWY
jgi:exodeoxyribonuclease V alpha subunit